MSSSLRKGFLLVRLGVVLGVLAEVGGVEGAASC